MNICILTKSTLYHQIGGMEVHAQTLAEAAASLGHRITVITTSHPKGLEHKEQKDINYYFLKDTRSSRYTRSWWVASVNKLLQLHQEEKIDVIWAESFSGCYYARRFKAKIGIPIISVMQGTGIIGVIKTGWNAITSFQDLINFLTKYLPEAIFATSGLFFQTLRYSDAIIAISDKTKEEITREFFVPDGKTFVVYNGIDTEIFKPDRQKRELIRKRYALSSEERLLLMSGVTHKQKGMQVGIRALLTIKSDFPLCKMMVVGSGPHLEYLKNLTRELNLGDSVLFTGAVSNNDIAAYYNAADLFLNPTLRAEGLPLVILEAMACGLPVITSKIGGTRSTIEEGLSGFFIKAGDIKNLIERALLILNDSALAARMSVYARQKAISKFNIKKMAEQYLNLSVRIIIKKGSAYA